MTAARPDGTRDEAGGAGSGWADAHGPFYLGTRTARGVRVSRIGVDGSMRPLRMRMDLRRHSPDGAEWGYGGSGPAQLALALCADALGNDERALAVYQDFKLRVVGRLGTEGWALSAAEVRRVVAEVEAERALTGDTYEARRQRGDTRPAG